MKRNLGLVVLALFLASMFFIGCAKKNIIREEKAGAQESAAVTEPSATAVAPEAGTKVQRPASAEKAFTEEAIKEKAEAEKAAAEKAAAEKAAAEAAAKKAAAEKAAAEAAARQKAVELADIRFDFDDYSLRDDAREILKKNAEWLNKNKDVQVVVEGHCDERGTAEYNLALGERRAKAAAKFLMDMGITAKRIKTISYGEELPLDPGHNEEVWAKNRRAHFAVSGKK